MASVEASIIGSSTFVTETDRSDKSMINTSSDCTVIDDSGYIASSFTNETNEVVPDVPRSRKNVTDEDIMMLEAVKRAMVMMKANDGRKEISGDNEDDEENYDEIDSVDELFNSFIVRNSRIMSLEALYKAYNGKLEIVEERRKKAQKSNRADKERPGVAPRLFKEFADYLRTLENRIDKLEAGKGLKETPSTGTKVGTRQEERGDDAIKIVYYSCDQAEAVEFFDLTADERWKEDYESITGTPKPNTLQILYEAGGKDQSEPSAILATNPQSDILALKVHSNPLASFFEKLAGYQVHKDNLVRMVKPFRFLVRNASSIKEHLKWLQEYYSPSTGSFDQANKNLQESDLQQHPKNSEDQSQETPNIRSPYETVDAMHHFDALVRFIDTYLHHRVSVYQNVQLGVQEKLAFENLWMIYEQNEAVLCPARKGEQVLFKHGAEWEEYITEHKDLPQVYRVMTTTGGRSLFGQLTRSKAKVSDELVYKVTKSGVIERHRQHATIRAKDRYSALYVLCYFVGYNGKKFVPQTSVFVVRPYEGEAEIRSLEIFPIRYQAHQEGMKLENLQQRGLQFIDYTATTHLHYEGLTLGHSREEINGPVIIDLEQANQELEDEYVFSTDTETSFFWSKHVDKTVFNMPVMTCKDTDCTDISHLAEPSDQWNKDQCDNILKTVTAQLDDYIVNDIGSKNISLKEEMEKLGLLELLPGTVHGFALRDRKWLQFDVTLLKKVHDEDDESGWDDLILPEDHRAMVQSMVETHTAGVKNVPATSGTTTKSEIGLVQGKGKGCIILLHGVPGVGKTSTAECVAAYTKRPLFPITGGDIGYEPAEVERNLQKLFKLAHKWGCVLLIDEADVFLAERDKADVKRNGLVSVFLRILEYYSGILFLTTNRVGAFDDAFRSRIHLTLYYPKLGKEQSYRVWEMNITRISRMNKERVKNGQPKIKYDRDHILRFADQNYETLLWNGRQIQNAFQTALALARFKVRATPDKRPEIIVDHFVTIANASIEFDSYLTEVHRGDEAKNAKKKSLRADEKAPDTARKVQIPFGTIKSKRAAAKDESSEPASDESTTESSEEERERRKRRKSKAKHKGRKDVDEGEDVELETKSKKKTSKEGQVDEAKRSKKSKSKKAKKIETSSESGSSGE
ncbi:hypothetical protein CC80DRAFT_488785 [Byssothecium circinans]|uniref:AAA+ ATPase domain-containing protein n=1 Tax=Byssothecium circinans TaxID=147558 RepID=A0A6A5UC60_9PLEO|nr:hypothetical protein CC80DRAFT_488785 [Byssothecium circinans]